MGWRDKVSVVDEAAPSKPGGWRSKVTEVAAPSSQKPDALSMIPGPIGAVMNTPVMRYGVDSMLEGFASAADAASDASTAVRGMSPVMDVMAPLRDLLSASTEAPANYNPAGAEVKWDDPSTWSYIPRAVLESVPEMAAMVASGGGSKVAAMAPAFLTSFGRNVDAIEKANGREADFGDYLSATGGAAAAGVLEKMGLDEILSAPARSVIGRLFGATAGEMGTEALQSGAEQAAQTASTPQGLNVSIDQMLNEGLVGAGAGASFRGAIEARDGAKNFFTDPDIDIRNNVPRGGAPSAPPPPPPPPPPASPAPGDPAGIGGVDPALRPGFIPPPPDDSAGGRSDNPRRPAAAARLAERFVQAAGELGADLRDIDPTSPEGARVVLDHVHTKIAEEIKAVAADLRPELDPRFADDFNDLIRRATMKAAERGAKNKVKDLISPADIELVREAVGDTKQGNRLVNLMEESSLRAGLHRGGLAGGLTRWLQGFGLGPSGNYVQRSQPGLAGMGAMGAGAMIGSSVGGPIGGAIGAVAPAAIMASANKVAAGVDRVAGDRRSRVDRFVRVNRDPESVRADLKAEAALRDPRAEAVEAARREAEAAEAEALLREQERMEGERRGNELRKARRSRNDAGVNGVDALLRDTYGLEPNAVDEGLRILENEGLIRPSEARAFNEAPNELMDNNVGNRIFDMLRDLGIEGRIPMRQTPNTPPPTAPTGADPYEVERYKAGAKRNVEANLEAKDRVMKSGLDPVDAQIIATALDAMGAVNNRAEAEAIARKAVDSVGETSAPVALSELMPLLKNYRHATAEEARANAKRSGENTMEQQRKPEPTKEERWTQTEQRLEQKKRQRQYGDPLSKAPLQPPVNPDGTVTLDHFTGTEFDIADPAKWGDNPATPRGERSRIGRAPPRTYYGISTGKPGGYRQEFVGPGVKHKQTNVPAASLYDVGADPKGIRKDNPGAWEQAIKDAGFKGYWANNPELGMVAAVFTPEKVRDADTDTPAPSKNIRRQPVQQWQAAPDPEHRSEKKSLGNRISRDPVPSAIKSAEEYRNANPGITRRPLEGQPSINTSYLKKVADWLDGAKHEPNEKEVKRAYKALTDETARQYQHMLKTGIKVDPWTETTGEPYENSGEMLDDVRNGHLWFFRTENGFGEGADTTDHPLMKPTKFKGSDGKPLLVNDLFRIVHDYYGHAQNALQFGPKGEYGAFQEHARMFSPDAIPALAAETLAQNAWVNFGPHMRNADGSIKKEGDEGYLSAKARPFADQKATVIPWELLVEDTNPESIAKVLFERGESVPTEAKSILGSLGKDMKEALTIAANAPGVGRLADFLSPSERRLVSSRTAQKMVDIFESLPSAEEFASAAYAGRAKKGWYASSAQAILDVFGGADAPRFAALLAALSPQTSVESNAINAINSWINWDKAGRPTTKTGIMKVLGESVQGGGTDNSVLPAWINNSVSALSAEDFSDFSLSGPKVHSFMLNLVGVLNEVTNDTWMANFADVPQTMFRKNDVTNKGVGYLAFNARVREAANLLTEATGETWEPAEVQETVWSFAKTVVEARNKAGESRSIDALLKAGGVTHDDIASTPDFATLFTEGLISKLLEAGGYSAQITEARDRSKVAGRTPKRDGKLLDVEGSVAQRLAFEANIDRIAARLEKLREAKRAEERRVDQEYERNLKSSISDADLEDFV